MTGMKFNQSLHKKLDKAKMVKALEKSLRLTMKDVSETSSKKAPKKTGNLRRSHSYDVTGSGDHFIGRVKNNANYWVYVNFGTSKQNPKHFLEDAINTVKPAKKIKEYFNKEYKGG